MKYTTWLRIYIVGGVLVAIFAVWLFLVKSHLTDVAVVLPASVGLSIIYYTIMRGIRTLFVKE